MKVYVTIRPCQIGSDGKLGAGCVEAPAVVEPLAISRDVLQLRGAWELMKIGYDWRDMQASGPSGGNFRAGQLVEVTGTEMGRLVGKITAVNYADSVDPPSSTVTLGIMRLDG
jgi:hypothetical protein